MSPNILWYDLETFGLEPRHDRIAQFAAIRTDENLDQEIEEVEIYCKLPLDYLPSPYSCLVHGISPQRATREGLPEYEFAQNIKKLMSGPACTVAGYNSIKFDDEFIRNLFYRNLIDPYEREWADGNSRWDIINLMRAARDLRPDGINWPNNLEGKPDFTLGALAIANDIPLQKAHDAMFDIKATISMARLVKEKQTKLYEWFWRHRSRDSLRPLIDIAGHTPLIHTDATYTRPQGCSTIIAPISMIPGRRDSLVAVDLRFDVDELLDLDVEEIRRRVFSPSNRLHNEKRLPLLNISLGRCPYISPLSILDREASLRLELDVEASKKRAERLKDKPQLIQKILAVFSGSHPKPAESDPDYRIYSGGFFHDEDRDAMDAVHDAIQHKGPGEARPHAYSMHFLDERLPQMVRRMFARNWPETLSKSEEFRWRSFCAGRLLLPRIETAMDMAKFSKIVETLLTREDTPAGTKPILAELLEYKIWVEKEVLTYNETES